MNEAQPPVWYKQFWPWFLISVPLISMVLSFTMLRLASNTTDSLVIDDYYKEGKGINLELTKIQEARVQNIVTQLQVTDSAVLLTFTSGLPKDGEALSLMFQHATLSDKDFSVLLTKDAKNNYRASIDTAINGKWKITLMPLNKQWKIDQTVTFPRSEAITFSPQ